MLSCFYWWLWLLSYKIGAKTTALVVHIATLIRMGLAQSARSSHVVGSVIHYNFFSPSKVQIYFYYFQSKIRDILSIPQLHLNPWRWSTFTCDQSDDRIRLSPTPKAPNNNFSARHQYSTLPNLAHSINSIADFITVRTFYIISFNDKFLPLCVYDSHFQVPIDGVTLERCVMWASSGNSMNLSCQLSNKLQDQCLGMTNYRRGHKTFISSPCFAQMSKYTCEDHWSYL